MTFEQVFSRLITRALHDFSIQEMAEENASRKHAVFHITQKGENVHSSLHFGDEKTQIIRTALKLICNDTTTINQLYLSAYRMTDISSLLALVSENLQIF